MTIMIKLVGTTFGADKILTKLYTVRVRPFVEYGFAAGSTAAN